MSVCTYFYADPFRAIFQAVVISFIELRQPSILPEKAFKSRAELAAIPLFMYHPGLYSLLAWVSQEWKWKTEKVFLRPCFFSHVDSAAKLDWDLHFFCRQEREIKDRGERAERERKKARQKGRGKKAKMRTRNSQSSFFCTHSLYFISRQGTSRVATRVLLCSP